MAVPKRVLVYSDGASRGNRGPAAIGYTIYDEAGNCLEYNSRYIGESTNNSAEYEALIWAIKRSSAHSRQSAKFHLDSELVVRQVNGKYRVTKEHLRKYLLDVKANLALFESFEVVQVPRENPGIREVDELVNGTLDKEGL